VQERDYTSQNATYVTYSQWWKYTKLYNPDNIRSEMVEIIPNDINKSIKPDDSWQGNQGNESRAYDKCNQF
jgi:ABC-type cobalamin transport system ATPase subunit